MNQPNGRFFWHRKTKSCKRTWYWATRHISKMLAMITRHKSHQCTKWADLGEDNYSREVAAEDRRAALIEEMTRGLTSKNS